MTTALPATPHYAATEAAAPEVRGSAWQARLADYIELTKPKIAFLALVTVSVGYALALGGRTEWDHLWRALIGIAFVAAGSSALNQFFERRTDARMERTRNRPLPAGRLTPAEVLTFGIVSGVLGTAYLAFQVNVLTAVLGAATLVLYAFVYTPLKRYTTLNTAIGAIPGALPPVLGWTAAGGSLDQGAFALFAALYLWQFPHFMAIAWLYRQDYARAGMKMLTIGESASWTSGMLAVGYSLALLPVSLLPSHCGLAGTGYVLAALVLGLGYIASSCCFLHTQSEQTARRLLWTSLIYLPALLLALVCDHYQLLS